MSAKEVSFICCFSTPEGVGSERKSCWMFYKSDKMLKLCIVL